MFKRKNVTKQLTEKITEKEFKKLPELNEFIKSYYYCEKKKEEKEIPDYSFPTSLFEELFKNLIFTLKKKI